MAQSTFAHFLHCINKILVPSLPSRIGRVLYLKFLLLTVCFVMIVLTPLYLLQLQMELEEFANFSVWSYGIRVILLFVSIWVALNILRVAVRRLHDMDLASAWILLSFVPFIAGILGLFLLLWPGTKSINRFGMPGSKSKVEDLYFITIMCFVILYSGKYNVNFFYDVIAGTAIDIDSMRWEGEDRGKREGGLQENDRYGGGGGSRGKFDNRGDFVGSDDRYGDYY